MTQPIRPPCFDGFDLAAFWADSDYARKEYTEPPPTPQAIAAVEAELGYRLPASYVALMQRQNGGIPINRCFPTGQPTSWAEDHVAISAFKGIGFQKQWSLCGGLGSRFKIEEWEYPDIGVYFGDCPSAGHDMIALDYRACGPAGEPAAAQADIVAISCGLSEGLLAKGPQQGSANQGGILWLLTACPIACAKGRVCS